MPRLDSSQVCRAQKEDRSTKKIKVVIVNRVADARKVAKDAGADGYISEPIRPDELTNKVRSWL